jgi:hypothetical protein
MPTIQKAFRRKLAERHSVDVTDGRMSTQRLARRIDSRGVRRDAWQPGRIGGRVSLQPVTPLEVASR